MNLDSCVANACEPVPGLVRGALALLPEGLVIGGVGDAGVVERELLARSAAQCLNSAPNQPDADAFIEHLFVGQETLIVIVRGQRYPQLALTLICTADANPTFVLSLTRMALRSIEATVDLSVWEP